MHRPVVLGFRPEFFRPEYGFVAVVGELFNGSWHFRGNPAQAYPPTGDIYIPREAFPDDFHEGDAAAWEIEDQPNYAGANLSCRFRAVRLADAPLEVVPVPWESTDPALRKYLQETGVASNSHRTDRNVLLDFPDGLIVRARVQSRPDNVPIVLAADLALPLEAWSPGEISLLTVESRRGTRRFCTLPVPPKATLSLDLSTLEEALTSAKRPGGLGSLATLPPAELRVHLKRLEEVMQSFGGPAWQARRIRLDNYLAAAEIAIEELARWEAFLTEHSVFRKALQTALTGARDELQKTVRAEVLSAEPQLQQKLHKLTKEWEELEGIKIATEREVSNLRSELSSLNAKRPAQIAPAPARGTVASDNGKSPSTIDARVETRSSLEPEQSSGAKAVSLPLRYRNVCLPLVEKGETLSTPAQAMAHLEKNLQGLGIIKISSRLLAREILVATSLGQFLLFRGSFAGPVAEAVAVSLTGPEVRIIAIPVGAIEPLPLSRKSVDRAYIFEGANHSCLDAYGTAIQELVRNRVLGLTKERSPVLIGTLGDGPSCLPPDAHLLSFGPVFDTDAFSWDLQKEAATIVPGRCESSVWTFSDKPGEEEWDEFLDELFPVPILLWERSVRAAYRRLGGLTDPERPNQPKWSLLFAWILPRLLACDGELDALAKHLKDDFLHGATSDDQRVGRLLRRAGMKAKQ